MNAREKNIVNLVLLIALIASLILALTFGLYLPMACLSILTLIWLFLQAD